MCGGLGQPRGICNSRAHLFLCRFSRCNAASIAPLRVLLSRPPTPEKKCASPLAARSPARSPPPPLAPGLGSAIITCARGFPWLVAETCPSLHGGDPCLLPCILLIARPGHLWLQSGDVLCQSVRSSRIAALAPVCSLALLPARLCLGWVAVDVRSTPLHVAPLARARPRRYCPYPLLPALWGGRMVLKNNVYPG